MGITTTASAGNNTNLRYSAFLGMLYISNTEVEATIKEAKALPEVGEDAVKRGFAGNRGDSASAKAISYLKEKGVAPVKVSGTLIAARAVERGQADRKAVYLSVCLSDNEGRYWLSLDLGNPGVQMLARKLYNAVPGVETELNLFATYEKRPGAARAYANHAASVRQNGVEVQGVSPKDKLAPMVNSALTALEAAGVPRTDRETYNKRRSAVELDYHVGLMSEVEPRFKDLYESGQDRAVTGGHAQPGMDASGTSQGNAGSGDGDDFGDFPGGGFEDDMPF